MALDRDPTAGSEAQAPLVAVEDLVVRFPIRTGGKRQFITPVDHVNFTIGAGEVLSLVGESGSGKSTIAKALVRTVEPNHGTITVGGLDITHIGGRQLMDYRRNAQMIFQDPFGSLNPVHTVEHHLAFPVRKYRRAGRAQIDYEVGALLERVGLTPISEMRVKYPHELSGGQRQRVAIARALAANPALVVADEPISMLDVSIRAGVLSLMNELKRDLGLSYLYITHDLASARYFGDRIMVLYGGKVMETADSRELLRRPTHPYTRLLLAATPGNRHRGPLPEVSNGAPDLVEGRRGCPFAPRCPAATAICSAEEAPTVEVSPGHSVVCHHTET